MRADNLRESNLPDFKKKLNVCLGFWCLNDKKIKSLHEKKIKKLIVNDYHWENPKKLKKDIT